MSAVDSRSHPDASHAVFAIVLLAAIMPITLLVAPLLVAQLIAELGFTASDGGYLLSIELAAMCSATVIALALMDRVSWRVLIAAGVGVGILGNIGSAFATTFWSLAALRIFVGLGAGTIMSLCLAAIGRTSNQDRNFAFWLISQILSGAVGLLVLGWVFKTWGLAGFYVGVAMLELPLLWAASYFYDGSRGNRVERQAGDPGLSRAALGGLASILLVYVAIGGVWAFVERIGHASALEPGRIAFILAGATALGLLGSVTASLLGGRILRTRLLIVGFALVLLALSLLYGRPPELRYALAAGCFKFAWNFVIPFMLASISSRDSSGKMIVMSNFVLGGGLALGPAVAAFILSQGAGYNQLIVIMLGFAIASALVLLGPELRRKSRSRRFEMA